MEASIQKGIAVPALRTGKNSTFEDALRKVRGSKSEPGIVGIRENADRVCSRLMTAAKANPNFLPEPWPKHSVGQKFDEVIKRNLQCMEPPKVDPEFGIDRSNLYRLWDGTAHWRIDCINEARDNTRRYELGLRRGEILNAIGHDLGFPRDYVVKTWTELFERAKTDDQREALQLFSRWVTECYQYNQASEFGAAANSPICDPLGGLMAISHLPEEPSPVSWIEFPRIVDRIPFPSIESLRAMRPQKLLEVRQSEGAGYLAALDEWQKDPNRANETEVRTTLREYAKELHNRATVIKDPDEVILDVVIGSGASLSRRVLGRVFLKLAEGVILVAAASVVGPSVAALVALKYGGFNGIQLIRHRPRVETITIKGPKPLTRRAPPEVNVTDPT